MTNTESTAIKLANIDRAAADQKLSDLGFRLLWLLSSAADRNTGVVRRRQTDLAQMLGVKARTVRRGLDHLVARNYLEPIGVKPGKYISGYKVVMSRKRTPESTFEKADKNVHSGNGRADIPDQKADISDQKEDIPYAHKTFISLDIPCAPSRDTEPGGPRRALGALGPLGELEGELRQRLGGRFDLLSMAKVLPTNDDTVRLSVLTPYQRDQIKLRCEADILAAAGASQIEYVVELASTAFMEKAR